MNDNDFTLDDNPDEPENIAIKVANAYVAQNHVYLGQLGQSQLNQANQGIGSQNGAINQQAIGNHASYTVAKRLCEISGQSYQEKMDTEWRQWFLMIYNMAGRI